MEFPTISYEDALAKEMEYMKRIMMIHLHVPWPYHTTYNSLEISQEPRPLRSVNNPVNQTQTQFQTPIQTNSQFVTQSRSNPVFQTQIQTQTQPQIQMNSQFGNHYQTRPNPIFQTEMNHQFGTQINSQPIQRSSYWCRICNIDCTTECNFKSHVKGKKHQANKRMQGFNRGFATGNRNRRN